MNEVIKLKDALKTAKNILIVSHIGPDGDTLGSMLALGKLFKQIKSIEKIDMLTLGRIPDAYKFLPGIANTVTVDSEGMYQSYDIVITADCASIDRIGEAIGLFRNAKKTINIDHHISNTKFAQINIIENKAATGQVIFDLIKKLELELTEEIATCLYTAILTDTGGFRFESTTPQVLRACADLLETGVNPTLIYKECYEKKPQAMVKLHAAGINNTIFVDGGKIAYTLVPRSMLAATSATDDHVDGIAEALRQIDTVEVSLVFKETLKGATKVSFRSKKFDVCEIAKFFGGGGHKLAAGCTIEKPLEETAKEVIPMIKKRIGKNLATATSK